MKLIIVLLCFSLSAKAQDTLKISKVRVSKKVELSAKTNKIIRSWPHWVKVDEGYIVHSRFGLYYFNGKFWKMAVDENKNLIAFSPSK